MSKYTTEVRWVVEQTLDDLNLAHDEKNWPKCWKVLGLDDYPIFQETHRDELNMKIVRRYYTREICTETVGRWRMFVRDAMHTVMPYYNQLYESEAKSKGIDFLNNRDLQIDESKVGQEDENKTGTEAETQTGTKTQADSGSSKSSSESKQTGTADTKTTPNTTVTNSSTNTSDSTDTNIFSDTPQSEMVPDQIKAMKYASNVTIDTVGSTASANGTSKTTGTTDVHATDTSTASGSGTGSYDNDSKTDTSNDRNLSTHDTRGLLSKDTLDRQETGVVGSRAELLKEWRESMMNIDEMVIEDKHLRECFMMVW